MRLAAAYTGYLREPEVASSSHWCVPETSSLMAQRPLCSGQRAQGIPLRCTLLPGKKDGAEARLARPRAFQSVIDLCEREHLDHGANARLCGKGQRFLRILGVAALPAANCPTAKDELAGQHSECSAASVRHDDHGAISPQS